MNHLHRELAPVTERGWSTIDDEAKGRLGTYLAARRLVDFHGPHGWDFSALNLGRTTTLSSDAPAGIEARTREVLPLVEFYVPFEVETAELEALGRGATDIDLDALDAAAKRITLAENAAVFHGFAAGGITGIVGASSHEPIVVGRKFEAYPQHVARAVQVLLEAGVSGPYALALSSDIWTTVIESSEHGGYPLFEHLRKAIVGGPIVWTPGIEGGIVLSQRGGDFRFESGEDVSIGYSHHDRTHVTLYLEESFTFKVDTPDAAVSLLLE